jgi:hypothetical protein
MFVAVDEVSKPVDEASKPVDEAPKPFQKGSRRKDALESQGFYSGSRLLDHKP